jgi:hypothetical protein
VGIWRKYVLNPHAPGFGSLLFSDDFRFMLGQEDPVPLIELSKEDTAKLTAAHDALVASQKEAGAFHQHIVETYIAAHGSETAGPPFMIAKPF